MCLDMDLDVCVDMDMCRLHMDLDACLDMDLDVHV